MTFPTSMKQIPDFAPNPAGLRMHLYAPASLPLAPPLVVALHGCLQAADVYARETGWNALADRYGFVVLYPEQTAQNHERHCFRWWEPAHQQADEGEPASIRAMIHYAQAAYDIDPHRIYVTGLSAGGCMTATLLATSPALFAAGAILSAAPYGAAGSLEEALLTMQGGVSHPAAEWARRVQAQNPGFAGPYPRVALFQGAQDEVVSPQNLAALTAQWTYLHGLNPEDGAPMPGLAGYPEVTGVAYGHPGQPPVVVSYLIEPLGHALAVHPGPGPRQGGATGTFAVDVGFYSAWWVADFFGLTDR